MRNDIIKKIESHGFRKVKFYERVLDDWYYDAILPNGKRVEIMVRDNKIYWRYLRNDKINLSWKEIGNIN